MQDSGFRIQDSGFRIQDSGNRRQTWYSSIIFKGLVIAAVVFMSYSMIQDVPNLEENQRYYFETYGSRKYYPRFWVTFAKASVTGALLRPEVSGLRQGRQQGKILVNWLLVIG